MAHRCTQITEYVCTSEVRMDHVLGLLVYENTFWATILGHGLNYIFHSKYNPKFKWDLNTILPLYIYDMCKLMQFN